MGVILGFVVGAVFALVVRKWITKQPLLKARVDSWVDDLAEKADAKIRKKDS